jgi:hypothetical protein
MKEFQLDFKFKGDRNYVQGPDIYNKVMEFLYAENFTIKNIDLSFHKIARHNLRGEIFKTDSGSRDAGDVISIFKFTDDNESYVIHLFETDSVITEHTEYYEEKIVELSTLNVVDKTIILSSLAPYTNIEKIVALNKALLNKLLTDPGKWYFTKLTVDGDINNKHPYAIQVALVKNIGSKITKSQILFDGKEKGHLYFSKV